MLLLVLVHACVSPMLLRLLYYLLTHSLILSSSGIVRCTSSLLLLIIPDPAASASSTIRIKCLKEGQSGIAMVLLTTDVLIMTATTSANDHLIPQTIRLPVLSCLLLRLNSTCRCNWIIIFVLFGRAHQNVVVILIAIELEELVVGRVIELAFRSSIRLQPVQHLRSGRVH